MSFDLRELLDRRVLIGDGAVGTLLAERGVGFGHPYARANLSHPEMVTEIHEEYLRAGADVVETNTFAANRFKLETHDLENRVREVNASGASLAVRAARNVAGTGDRALVLGAVGPLGRPLAPVGPVGPEEARSVFLEQAEALLEGGADAILLETFTDLVELRLAHEAVYRRNAFDPTVAGLRCADPNLWCVRLTAPREVLVDRISSDVGDREACAWRTSHVEACLKALCDPALRTEIRTEDRTLPEVVDQIPKVLVGPAEWDTN